MPAYKLPEKDLDSLVTYLFLCRSKPLTTIASV